MGRYKNLVKNVGVIGISQFSSKALTFLLVPLYTNVLSTAEYGTYDIYNTVISLLMPILTLNIYDAMLRFALDKENDSSQILKIGLFIFACGTLLLCLVCFVFVLVAKFNIFESYIIPFLFLYISTTLTTFFSNYSRGIGKIKTMAIAGIVSTIAMLIFNILFLAILRTGLNGYFWANALGLFAGLFYYSVSLRIWIPLNKCSVFDKTLAKSMVKYSVPMIINSLSWWLNISSLRYAILVFLGVSANGLFAVSYKIPNLIGFFSSIFFSAWTISSVEEFDKNDKNGFFLTTYNLYQFLIICAASLIIIFTKPIAYFMYAKEFYDAWQLVPFMTLSAVFSAISGYAVGIFSAVKRTKELAISTFVSSLVNVVLGILGVWAFGLAGAACAVMVSSYVLWLFRFIQIKKYVNIGINLIRDHLVYILLLAQALVMMFCQYTYLAVAVNVFLLCTILLCYRRVIFHLYLKFVKKG